MAEVTVVYWRDIPAQVIVGRGRKAVKAPLSERFEQAIDRAAMKAGLAGTDDYLAQWRKAAPITVEGSDADAAASTAAGIEHVYNLERLKQLIAAGGLEPTDPE